MVDETMVRPPKRRRGRPSKYSELQHFPEFFKVYLPQHNSKQLVIPPDFINIFKGKIPKRVILKNLDGKVWKVELEKHEHMLLMKNGWEGFVIDNSLERGEFLIFAYIGNAVFLVKVFSINGCKKDGWTATYDQPHHNVKEKVHQEANSDRCMKIERVSQYSSESKYMIFTKVYDARPYEMHIPAGIFTKYNVEPPKMRSPETILLWNQRGISQEVKIAQRHDHRVVLSSGWRKFQLDSEMVLGDECEFEIIVDEGRKIKEMLML